MSCNPIFGKSTFTIDGKELGTGEVRSGPMPESLMIHIHVGIAVHIYKDYRIHRANIDEYVVVKDGKVMGHRGPYLIEKEATRDSKYAQIHPESIFGNILECKLFVDSLDEWVTNI